MRAFRALPSARAALGISLMSPLAAVQGKPFRISVSNDRPGPYAVQSGAGSVLAAGMAAQDFGGKVFDRPVEIIVADNQNKPDLPGRSHATGSK
jgi:branched-chain amino acid transport system substrate-binding protein